MIIYHFSSEDFRPKRLVYEQDLMGFPKGVAPEPPKSETPPAPSGDPRLRMSPKQREAYDERVRKAYVEARKSYGELSDEIKKEVKDAIENGDVQEQIKKLTESMGSYVAGKGWQEWNKKFGERIGLTDPEEIKQKVRAFQRVLFAELGITGDPSAIDDGKIGPYTLAAMAARAGKANGITVPVSENNKALAAYVQQKVEAEMAASGIAAGPSGGIDLAAHGSTFLEGASNTIKMDDGAILVRTGEGAEARDTYYKYVDGKWKWASQEQYEINEWDEIGETPYSGNGEGEIAANEMAAELRRYQDEVLVYNGEQQDYVSELMTYGTGNEYLPPNPSNEACESSMPDEWQDAYTMYASDSQLPTTESASNPQNAFEMQTYYDQNYNQYNKPPISPYITDESAIIAYYTTPPETESLPEMVAAGTNSSEASSS